MNEQTQQGTPRDVADGPRAWRRYGVLVALVTAGVVALYFPTAWSMAVIWESSATFAHGYLVVPIALWLAWDKRGHLRLLHPYSELRRLWITIPLGLIWLLGNLVDVQIIQQYAFVGMLAAAVWITLGTPVTKVLAFPLGYLLLAVPVGQGLIPPLMDFTADFTVSMLRLTGIPVYREGTFFSIPSGNWSVIEACAGLRYLIASVTLGVLYAYLTYRWFWKRLVFVLASIAVPILANGIRAYGLVMTGHLSNMKLGLGLDHFVFGWLIFGIAMTAMFLVGAIWRDKPAPLPAMDVGRMPSSWSRVKFLSVAPLVLGTAGAWPLAAWFLAQDDLPSDFTVEIPVPAVTQGWRSVPDSAWDWRPALNNPDGELYRFYEKDGRIVGLYLGLYVHQRRGAELINVGNQMVREDDPEWSDKGRGSSAEISLGGKQVRVNRAKPVSTRGQRILVWYWNRMAGFYTTNNYAAKLLELASRLGGGRRDGAMIAVAAAYDQREADAAAELQAFLDAMLPEVERSLDLAAGVE